MLTKGNDYKKLKRVAGAYCASLGLIASAPVIAAAALVVYAEDPHGSPFYSQIRIGKDGKPFRMYKLRTMRHGTENELESIMHLNEMDGPVFKIKDDPRITKVGKFLRKTSLDELPQLVNVLAGDMALVGPRPPLPMEYDLFKPWHKGKLAVTPGMTCYWQIAKDRNDIPFDDWVKMDLEYIKDMSLKTDLLILAKTVLAVFRMQGR